MEYKFNDKAVVQKLQELEQKRDSPPRQRMPNKYKVMKDIEIDRTNKKLYEHLSRIENTTKITWNPLIEKSEQLCDMKLTRRHQKMVEIEKANFHLL